MRYMNLKRLLFSMALLIMFLQAGAATIDTPMRASFLHSACIETDTSAFAKGDCEGAIAAYNSLMPDWCVPGNVTHGEIHSYIKDQLIATNRSLLPLGTTASDFIYKVIRERWPCDQ